MKVQDILKFLAKKFPVDKALDFDNVGLLIGDQNREVSKAVITLDCTMKAIETALQNGAELIITHHPVIFEPLKNILKGSIAYEVISNGLSVISMHTNLDVGVGGVNDTLCKMLSPLAVETVTASDGYTLKKCSVAPISADALADNLKTALGGSIKYTDSQNSIEKILVCSGSGGGYISEVKQFGCDALVTADVKHNQFVESELYGVSLFDTGHFNTEDIIVEPLKELLEKEFCDISFITYHNNAIKNR